MFSFFDTFYPFNYCMARYHFQVVFIFLVLVVISFFFLHSPGRDFFLTFHEPSILIPLPRWRNNSYIRDDGLLPFQRCNSEEFYPGPMRLYGKFTHSDGIVYNLVATALSVFGQTDLSGKPTEAPAHAELLVYFQPSGKGCRIIGMLHCATELIRPTVVCRRRGTAEWMKGKADFLNATITSRVQPFEWIALASLICPLGPGLELTDAFEIEWRVGGSSVSTEQAEFFTDVCYHHVSTPSMLVICTMPHFGFDTKSSFWMGSPAYSHGNLIDAFLLYHAQLMQVSVVFNDLYDSCFSELERYKHNSRIKYRSHWELALHFSDMAAGGTTEHEILAEATCMWEHRLNYRWHMQAMVVDNFILPMVANKTVAELLLQVDEHAISELAVPIIMGNSDRSQIIPLEQLNVLQRYDLLGPELHYSAYAPGDWATTPIANPRHHQFGIIHWMEYGKNPKIGLPVMSPSDVLHNIGIQTLHLHVLSGRPNDFTGESFIGLSDLGNKLQKELISLPPSTCSPSTSPSSSFSPTPSPRPPEKLVASSWGRLGNKLFQAMGQHLLAKKFNLQASYDIDALDKLGLQLWNGTFLMTGNELVVTDNNFPALMASLETRLSVRLVIPSNTYLQLPFLARIIRYDILLPAKDLLLHSNPWKHRLHNNSDTFVHVRLGDIIQAKPTATHFFAPIKDHLEGHVYISSDSPEDPIVLDIASRYNGTILSFNEVQTWQFAAMCKHLVLHDGSFSWWAGVLASIYGASVSHVLRPDLIWAGDIYIFDDWQAYSLYP